MTAGKVFSDFSQWTSAHGIPHVGASQNKWLKVFWLVILTFSMCMFFMQLSQLIIKYLDYDVTVQTELKFDQIPFPSVTICNINAYSWGRIQANSGVGKIKDIFEALTEYEERNTTSDSEDAEMQGHAEEKIMYLAAGLTAENKKKITYDRTDNTKLEVGILSRCTYDQEPCKDEDFKEHMDLTYGSCYTYNFNGSHISNRAGPAYGMRVLAISNQDEYMPTTDSVGVRMTVHNANDCPYVDAFGYNAAAGFTTSFGVKFVTMSRQPYPYGNCTYDNKLGSGYDKCPYSVEGCFRVCFQSAIMEQCGCGSPKFELPEGVDAKYCTQGESDCVEQVLNGTHPDVGDVITSCTCPQPCEESSFAVTVSTAVFPSTAYTPPECKGTNAIKGTYPWNPDKTLTGDDLMKACTLWFRDNTMMLEVYYERMNFQMLRESEAYTLVNLVSDLGGQLGLWLGVSVITVLEIISFLIMTCAVVCGKKQVKTSDVDEGSSPFDGKEL